MVHMSEYDAIEKIGSKPNTIGSLIDDFKILGLKPGMTVIVHSSLSSLGWVCGGAQSVLLALESVLTKEGTLVMPAHSGDLSDPKNWQHPPVPESWWETIRNEMPCFGKDITPTRGIGILPEVFRSQDSVLRSSHPQLSFSAWGKNREYIVQDNHYDYAQNRLSPLGRIYELDGYVLLIGVDHENNTSLHLAEYIADYKTKKIVSNGMPVIEDGIKKWKEFEDIDISSDDFAEIGREFEKTHEIITGKAGMAECRLIKQRAIVDFAVRWMEENRT